MDRDDFEAILIIPRLYSISADTYRYFKSINVASKNFESLIAEPTKTYTNINNGLGIFGGMAMGTDTIMIMTNDLN
jgi:hypothetical protein